MVRTCHSPSTRIHYQTRTSMVLGIAKSHEQSRAAEAVEHSEDVDIKIPDELDMEILDDDH
jgi:hypothetical protein